MAEIRAHLRANQNNLGVPLQQAEDVLNQLASFDLGRHLLLNGSLNGYWTRYCMVLPHPAGTLHPLEEFLINKIFLSARERFRIFQEQLQKRLGNDMALASIPSGLMDDLLGLNFQGLDGVTLTGFDIDPASVEGALEIAKQYNLPASVRMQTQAMDAWDVGSKFPETFNIISSNGLNFYVTDPEMELALYRSFADALKSGGSLITSFLTPPPSASAASPWLNVRPEMLTMRKLIFSDILGVKWRNYNTPAQMMDKLRRAGFADFEIIYDGRRIYPTIIAGKGTAAYTPETVLQSVRALTDDLLVI